MEIEPDIQDAPDAIAVDGLRGDIRFENVTFGYGPEHTVLSGINLRIRAGETVAFVGPSGAGKTTIASLLPRFYEIDAGRITIDGIDIQQMTLASLRREIGVVAQDVFLFAGTIRENIVYGRLDATDDEIAKAVRRARMVLRPRSGRTGQMSNKPAARRIFDRIIDCRVVDDQQPLRESVIGAFDFAVLIEQTGKGNLV